MRFQKSILAVATLFSLTLAARATTVTYTTSTATFGSPVTLNKGNGTYTGFTVNAPASTDNYGLNPTVGGPGTSTTIKVTFTGAVTEFGYDYSSYSGALGVTSVTFSNGDVYSPADFPTLSTNGAFFGLSDDVAFTSAIVTLTNTSGYKNNEGILFNDLRSANIASAVIPPSAATPEPSSLVLLGTGILGLATTARRRFLNA